MPKGLWLHGIKKSDRKDKKYVGKFCMCQEFDACKGTNTKEVHFGQKGSETYVDHGDKQKREAYLARHKVNEDWTKPDTPGALSRWILWGDSSSLAKNIGAFRKKFSL